VNFAIVNESTQKELDTVTVGNIAAAVQLQCQTDYAALWGADKGTRCYVVPSENAANPGDTLIVLLDNADQAGALGYHDVTPAGRPYARIFCETILANQGTTTQGANSVSVCVSHEALETLGDAFCNGYADNGDGSLQVAQELADPVEGSSYTINGISVSDFLAPAWFDPADTKGPWDRMGVLRGPMTVDAQGYVISRAPGGAAQATFGARYPTWKREAKGLHGSRTRRRVHVAEVPTNPEPRG
jgi:hypothetical protein